ncbi:MAG TPA: prolyl-tRNA synthetase associated domain-containing protein [Vicinamibacterales bacterium]|nr:prolyl-tRNA synthetase associated domain-containing protein [Vicinamibacterales bacterium]
MSEATVEAYLTALGVPFMRHEHPPVATVAEAEHYWGAIDALHAKNLFLRDQKGTRHFLVVLESKRRADLKALGTAFGAGKLGFASPERLLAYLGLAPGAVSPFGLIHDPAHLVEVALDAAIRDADRVAFHPNVNTATLVLAGADFRRYLAAVGHEVRWI